MSENGKNVSLIVWHFHTKSGKRKTLSFFQKRRFQSFISEILRVVGLRRSVYINVVLLMNFPEQFKLCFHLKYSSSYEVL